jgi:hypothetical protein
MTEKWECTSILEHRAGSEVQSKFKVIGNSLKGKMVAPLGLVLGRLWDVRPQMTV